MAPLAAQTWWSAAADGGQKLHCQVNNPFKIWCKHKEQNDYNITTRFTPISGFNKGL